LHCDSEPGTFEFSKPSLLFKESAGKALIPIERHSGGDGHVEVKYRTEDMSAISGKDFEGGNGVIMFEHGEMTKTLEINIYDDMVGVSLCITIVSLHNSTTTTITTTPNLR